MNYPVPFIALFTLGSKFLIKKYSNPYLALAILLTGISCAGLIFYAGFAHLISSDIFYYICWFPAFNAFGNEVLDYYGYSKYSIPANIILNCIAASAFIPYGILKVIQVAWSLSLISSAVTTLGTDVIKPFREARSKKHEFSI